MLRLGRELAGRSRAADRVLESVLKRLGGEASPAHHRAVGLVSGWTAAVAERRLGRLERRWRRFARAEPFWRS